MNAPTVLLFNAGLASHILAVRETSSSLFERALLFYESAYKLIRNQEGLHQYATEMDIVYMALVSNMSHCYARLQNTNHMVRYHNELCHIYLGTGKLHRLTIEEQAFFEDRIETGVGYWRLPAAAA